MSNARLISSLVLVAAIVYRLWSSPDPSWRSASISSIFSGREDLDDYPSDVVNLTRKLVSFGMVEPHAYIAAWLSSSKAGNMSVTVHAMNGSSGGADNRSNVLAVPHGARVSDVRVLLFTHMDLVPGGPPLELSGDDGYLYGRGTTDARGILAAMMVSTAKMAAAGIEDVAILAVTGEETTHDGVKSVADWDNSTLLPEDVILVNGEPTEGKIATSQKGILKFIVGAQGTPAHSGYPSLGKSAILTLIAFLQEMSNTDWNSGIDLDIDSSIADSGNTMNIGTISGGTAANIVPAAAEAVIAFRCVSDPEALLARVQKIASRYDGVHIHIGGLRVSQPMSFYVPPKSARKFGTYQANYNTDVPSYPRKYKHAVLFGGGTIHVAHTDHERAHIQAVRDMPAQFEHIVRELLEE